MKNVGFLFLLLLTGCTVHVHTGSDAAKAIGVGVVARQSALQVTR